ncbi:signal peptide protein [Metabacillus sp. SLBN-84]
MLDIIMAVSFAALALLMAGLISWSEKIVNEGREEK